MSEEERIKKFDEEQLEILLNNLQDIDKFTGFKDGAFKYELGKYQANLLVNYINKYKEVIDNLKDKLMKYFEVGRDSYFYVLTRDKSAFGYGTMSFDDFIEFSEEQVDDIVDFLKEVEYD